MQRAPNARESRDAARKAAVQSGGTIAHAQANEEGARSAGAVANDGTIVLFGLVGRTLLADGFNVSTDHLANRRGE